MRLGHIRIARIEGLRRIVAVMAVMMVRHIGIDISLIVIQIHRLRTCVVRGEIAVIIRRHPNDIARVSVELPHRRAFDEDRTNDIVIAVEPAVADHLHIERVRTTLGDERSHILEDRRSQTSLNKQRMVAAAIGLDDTQVVDPTVTVQVEVVDHILARIEQLLELLNVARLGKSCSNGIEVEVERHISVVTRHGDRGDCSGLGRRRGDLRRIDGLGRRYRLYRRSYRKDRRPATGEAKCRKSKE